MSRSPQTLLDSVKKLIPVLKSSLYKGQCGKVAIIGGCQEYTGAPYYASYSALKIGCDLSHIFCTTGAATAIKSYSPELIVHPVLKENVHLSPSEKEEIVKNVTKWFPALHSLVIGPGLGRDPSIQECVKDIIHAAKEAQLPIVLDGDALGMVAEDPSLISGYKNAVLTPNVAEYERLFKNVKLDPKEATIQDLASELKVNILQKGTSDKISDGNITFECSVAGGLRRYGGQGDVLAGTLGTFLAWGNNAIKKGEQFDNPYPLLAAFGAAYLARRASYEAFMKFKRGTTTPNMIDELPNVFEETFPNLYEMDSKL